MTTETEQLTNAPCQWKKLPWIIKTNNLGQSEYHLTCPVCKEEYVSPKRTDFYRHFWHEHQIRTGGAIPGSQGYQMKKQTSEERIKRKQEMLEKHSRLIKTVNRRIFYVDTAYSVLSRENVRYWKSSLVDESKKELASFVNSKVKYANEAEAYAILKAVYYFVENKIIDKVLIFSDSLVCVKALKGKGRKVYLDHSQELTNFTKYTYLIKKLIKENNLDVKFEWVKGEHNPADYYSRIEYKWHKPNLQGKLINNE